MEMHHSEHAAKARDLIQSAKSGVVDSQVMYYLGLAQVHATLVVYEALILPSYGMGIGEQAEWEREN